MEKRNTYSKSVPSLGDSFFGLLIIDKQTHRIRYRDKTKLFVNRPSCVTGT